MQGSIIQYLVGVAMLAFSVYQIFIKDYWESSLYISAGLAFVVMGLIKDKVFPGYSKLLNIVSWMLIGLAVFIFLFLLRTDS